VWIWIVTEDYWEVIENKMKVTRGLLKLTGISKQSLRKSGRLQRIRERSPRIGGRALTISERSLRFRWKIIYAV